MLVAKGPTKTGNSEKGKTNLVKNVSAKLAAKKSKKVVEAEPIVNRNYLYRSKRSQIN